MTMLHPSRCLRALLLLFSSARLVPAHMSIWHPGMFGFNGPSDCVAPDCFPGQDPVHPLGPGWEQSKWWFRGPSYTSQLPSPEEAAVLPAGGTWTVEITCHKDYTSYGSLTTEPGSNEECCPGSAGLYHAHLEGSDAQVKEGTAGCALGIADVTSPGDVTMDNLVIFSVQPVCVWTRATAFDIPAAMPACTGDYCICAWFWLAAVDLPNYYMTGFYCKIDGVTSTVRWGSPLRDAVHCADDSSRCVSGPRRAMYAFNSPNNTPEWDSTNPNAKRPAYGPTRGWAGGAQDDIFADATSNEGNVSTGASGSTGGATPEGSITPTPATSSLSATTRLGETSSHPSTSSPSSAPSASSSPVPATSQPSTDQTSRAYLIVGGGGIALAACLVAFVMFRRSRERQALAVAQATVTEHDEEKALRRRKRRAREEYSSSGESSPDDGR